MTSYEFVNVWPTNLTSMRVAYGNSNVLRCNIQLAYDRFFTDFGYTDTYQVPVLNYLPSNPQLKVQKTKEVKPIRGGQGGLPLGTTTRRQGGAY